MKWYGGTLSMLALGSGRRDFWRARVITAARRKAIEKPSTPIRSVLIATEDWPRCLSDSGRMRAHSIRPNGPWSWLLADPMLPNSRPMWIGCKVERAWPPRNAKIIGAVLKLNPPTRPRETLRLLSQFNRSAGLGALLDQVEWHSVSPLQVYYAVLGRLPEDAKVAVPDEGYSARAHAEAALLSDEFQQEVLKRVLDAFPEKRRLLFVHVPKCAGTDLIEHLSARYPSLSEYLSQPGWTAKPGLFEHLKNFVVNAGSADAIFVSGHIPLQWYLDHSLYRFSDRLFAVVRNPYDMVISQVNYVFKRFFEAPRCHHPDTREWADLLGIDMFDVNMPQDELRQLGFRILSSPQIVNPRNICTYLGDGTADSAFDSMARCNIELTEVGHYNAWLSAEWGIDTNTRANQSRPILKRSDLDAAQWQEIAEICKEDFRIYNRVVERLAQAGGYRVFGAELV